MMNVEREFARCLQENLAQCSPKFNGNLIKIYWCRRRKAKICDLVANLTLDSCVTADGNPTSVASDCLQKIIREVIKKSEEWCVPLQKCETVSTPALMINAWLNRAAMTAVVLNSIGKECKDFAERGALAHLQEIQALIYAPALHISAKSCGLSELRTVILMELTKRILETKRFKTWTSHHIHANGIYPRTCACNSENKTSAISEKLMPEVQQTAHNQVSEDDAKYIDPIEHADLQHILHSHVQKPLSACVMVTHRHVDVHTTTVLAFCNTMTEREDSVPTPLVRIVHGPVVWRNDQPSCTTTEELYRMQNHIVKNSFAHKYGASAFSEGDLGNMFDYLADLNIKFHMLACSTSKTVRLKIDERDSGGTFVMYNYARICLLLSNFKASTHDNILAPLPSIEEVDFSLLKKEEEWNLVLLLARYPKIIHDVASVLLENESDANISPAFHLIIEFISELCHRISIYYSHVRVLMPAVHLKDLMFARLWLLKCVKRTLEEIFGLLDVTPVKQM